MQPAATRVIRRQDFTPSVKNEYPIHCPVWGAAHAITIVRK